MHCLVLLFVCMRDDLRQDAEAARTSAHECMASLLTYMCSSVCLSESVKRSEWLTYGLREE